MRTRQELEEAVAKHGSQRAAARALGISQSTLNEQLKARAPRAAAKPSEAAPSARPVGFTRDDFRSKYDKNFIVPQRIREALKKLGPNRYLPEVDFTRLAGLSQTDMATFRPMFEDDFVVTVERTKRLWCGSKALAAEFRGGDHG
jgi:DNA-binding transcriptional regulator YdaS (Cro superfamily)